MTLGVGAQQGLRQYIEELIIEGRPCMLQFVSDSGSNVAIETKLVDFYTDDDTEYLMAEGFLRIPFSQILDIDGRFGGTA